MANANFNKVVVGGVVKLDLSADTASESTVLEGQTFHDKSGTPKVGTCKFDSDTSGDTAAVGEILKGKTAHARGAKLVGTMPNNGGLKLEVMEKGTPVKIPQGYHDGSGEVSMNADDAKKLIPQNVRQGVEILGVTGTMTGTEAIKLQAGKATSSLAKQTLLPPEGFNGFSQVVIEPVPVVESDNPAGGKTLTIG